MKEEIMNDAIIIEQHIDATCMLVIQHIKNVMQFQKNIKQSLGSHSRFMERLFHPEEILIYRGISKQLFENPTVPRRKEHIVPMIYLLNTIWGLLEEGKYTHSELAKILKNHLGVAYITKDEKDKLDSKIIGLKVNMPAGWRLGIDDPLARLKQTDIVLLKEDGMEISSLL